MRCSLLPLVVALTATSVTRGQQSQFENLVPLPTDTANCWDGDAGDVDGDGDIDLVWATDAQNLIYIDQGNLFYVDETQMRFPARAFNSREIRLVDLDGDNDLDCVVANEGPNRIMRNDGSGNFSILPIPRDRSFSDDLAVGDVDGDGDLDIMWACGETRTQQNRLWLQNNMVWIDVTGSRLPQVADPTAGVELVDLDGDGDLDAVFANQGPNGQNRLWVNDGTGRFTDATSSLPTQVSASNDVLAEDFDGDGDQDLLFVDFGVPSFRCQYLRNDGGLQFTDQRASFPNIPNNNQEAAAGDVDGDGDIDIIVTSWIGESVLVLNDGSASFSLAPLARVPADQQQTGGITLIDVDDDQDLDMVLANYSTQNRLELNLVRQVHTPLPAQIGMPYDIEIYAHAGFIATPQPIAGFLALAPSPWPGFTLSLPPWGNLHIPPSLAVAMPPLTVQPSTGGKVVVNTSIPNSPSLVNLTILAQIGVLHTPNVLDLRLSNTRVDVIQ